MKKFLSIILMVILLMSLCMFTPVQAEENQPKALPEVGQVTC